MPEFSLRSNCQEILLGLLRIQLILLLIKICLLIAHLVIVEIEILSLFFEGIFFFKMQFLLHIISKQRKKYKFLFEEKNINRNTA